MKTIRIILMTILIANCSLIYAQQHPGGMRERGGMSEERKEEIESMKIGFLTRKLNLTPDEAKKFWPVYNQYSDELKKLRDDQRNKRRDVKENIDSKSDKEMEKVVDDEIAFRQQELDVVKKYHSQFKQVLPVKKVAVLYRSEEEFKRELIEKIKERRNP